MPALLLCLTACGKGDFFGAPPVAQPALSPAVPGYSLYHAYGDSITAGYGLSDPGLVYASLAAAYNSVALSDNAISGDESCDVTTRQIFPDADSPALTSNGLYSLLIGTNDADIRGPGAGELTFNLCDQADLSWLATPLEYKVLATSSAVVVAGASHVETVDNFNAVTTDGLGASVTFPFTRTFAAAVYLWYRIDDSNTGTFTCSVDGTPFAMLQVAPVTAIRTQNGTRTSVAVLRMPLVAAGAHALSCTQTSAGPNGMGLIAIGGPPPAGTLKRPRLLAGLLPLQLNTGREAILAAYDADIRSNVALFAGDGLDIELFDAAAYMTGTTSDLSDALHPNALGNQEIFKAFQQVLY